MNLLITGGRLLDPSAETDQKGDILIENGIIKEVGTALKAPAGFQTINAEGLTVTPGFIDIHVHLRDPGQVHKEDIETGARAAAAGGFTSIVSMPNTNPVNDSAEVTEYIINKAKEKAAVNVFPAAAISKNSQGQTATHMEKLLEAGAICFSDDGHCLMNEELMKKALAFSQYTGCPIMEHPEDHTKTSGAQIHEGEVSRKHGLKGLPREAEDHMIERDIKLQEQVGGHLHLTHISTSGAAELIRKAKAKGQTVTADVTPHHLLLTVDTMTEKPDSVYKMKPPLREETDRLAMIKGIQDGTIDCIATDHAPHADSEKNKGFEQAAFGIIGLETAFSLMYDRLVRPGIIDLKQLVKVMAVNPAKIMNLNSRGSLKKGAVADITIVDLEKEFHFTKENIQSRSVNTPFMGWKGKGIVAYTIVNGKVVFSV